MIRLTLPVPPSANDWHRAIVMQGSSRMILTRKARVYAGVVQNAVLTQKCKRIPAPQEIDVEIVWYRARKAGDVDKRGAVLLDALQGIAYDNDSQIRSYFIVREEDKANPRMEITIMEAA